MKKNVFIGLLVFGLSTVAFAQSDLQVIAQVNYTKKEPITLGQLKKVVKGTEAKAGRKLTVDERTKLLHALIGQRLLIQASKKSGVKVLDSEVNNYFASMLSQYVGRPVNEAQFAKMIKQKYNQSLDEFFRANTGNSVSETKKMLKDEIMIQKFVMSKKQAEIARMATPSDGDIRKQYELNKQSFFRPDMMKLVIVGVIKQGKDAEEVKKIEKLREKVKKNKKNLAKIQAESANGGYVVQTRYALKNAAGAQSLQLPIESLMKIFEKPVQFVSEITDMPDNRQFFVITEKYDAKLLSLSDVIEPNQTITVYEAIKMSLTQKMQTYALQQANQALIQELRNDANTKVLLSDAKLKKVLAW